jgi:hypothetical protein
MYLLVNRLIFLKRSRQVLGMRQLAFLKLGIDNLATFLIVSRRIRFTNRGHHEFNAPREFTAHTMRFRHLTAQVGSNACSATRKSAWASDIGGGGFATNLARHFL